MADLSISFTQVNTHGDFCGVSEDLGNTRIKNGDFEITPPFTAAQTSTNAWINGTATGAASDNTYSWCVPIGGITSAADCQFDSSVSHSGTSSMKLETTNATGLVQVGSYLSLAAHLIPAIPSTQYTFTAWCNTNNVPTNACFVNVVERSAALGVLVTNTTNKLSGTNGWTQLTKTFTTNASTVGFSVVMLIGVAGNTCQAWFDDFTLYKTSTTTGVSFDLNPVITPGIQDISGPKIWS